MIRKRIFIILFFLANSAIASTHSTEPTHFVRYVENPDGSARLEAAETAYQNTAGVDVHLIGAVHIADPAFFEGLNESFEHYDALLYELVSSREPGDMQEAQPTTEPSLRWVGNLQRFLRDRLHLVFQLDAIDYTRPNFVHADLDPATFAKLQADRGESMFTLMLRSTIANMSKSMSKGEDVSGFQLLAALLNPNQSRELKRVLAQQFADLDDAMDAMEGPNGSVIVGERNKVALRVMNEQIAAGKKYIGIFYGAGHLRLMEKSLEEQGFKKVGETWRTAWEIGPPEVPVTKPTTRRLR